MPRIDTLNPTHAIKTKEVNVRKNWILIVAASVTVSTVLAVVSLVSASAPTAPEPQAGPPTAVSYQGTVEVGGSPYEGVGYFKFAVVDAAGDTTHWSNDGSSTGAAQPSAAVPLDVSGGLFNVLLGDTGLTGMSAPLTAAAFDGTERYLRVWFSETGTADTFTHLTPDRRIAAVPYALQAEQAQNAADADTVDGQHAGAFADTVHTHQGTDITSAVPTATLALSATQAASAADADTLDGHHASAFVARQGEAYVVVEVTDDPATNGDHLLHAYAEAAALTPHGQPLSTTNRAVVLLPPGQYDLGTDPLALDTEYVDLEGLSEDREKQHVYGTTPMTNTGVISQSANDVGLTNLFVEIRRDSGGVNTDASDPAAYFPEGDETATVIRNCHFKATDEDHAWSMRIRIEYPGTYERVKAYTYAFGGRYGTASGTFTHCSGGDRAFAGDHGTASGTFTDCTAGLDAFGGWGGSASGTFTDCTGGVSAFGGGGGTASGIFNHCTGGDHAFGGGTDGTASGTFIHCTGGDYAFAGDVMGTASGTFAHCTGGEHAFGAWGSAEGGVFRYCNAGFDSFTSNGTPEPVVLYCIQDGAEYTP